MAEDQPRRITFEDYSSSIVSQFFTIIAWPEVQAHNITYPHSLIQLIQGNLVHGLPNEDPYAHLNKKVTHLVMKILLTSNHYL